MSYAKGGEAFEDHLFGPDYDESGKIRKLGGTGLDGYMIHPETGETIGVEAGLHSKDFQQGRVHYKDGEWSAHAKNNDYQNVLNNLKLEGSDKTGLHRHVEEIYGHGHQPKQRERISRTTGQTKIQKFNPSGAAVLDKGEMHITHIDVDDAVNVPYTNAGKQVVMLDGVGAYHTGEHGHLDIPKFAVKSDAKKGLTMRVRHKNGLGALGLNVTKGDYVSHEPTKARQGMIDHFASQGFKFSRNTEGIKRSHLQNSGYSGPTDHLHILEDE